MIPAIALGLAIVAQAGPGAARASTLASPSTDQVRGAITRGIGFLHTDQNPDGSWGSARNATYTDLWENPETHFAWTIGTTGLACLALLERGTTAEAEAALDRGLAYLAKSNALRRCSEWDLDDTWGHLYGLQSLARALGDRRIAASPRAAALRSTADFHLAKLLGYQVLNGGWGYYASPDAAWRPDWGTSFMTGAVILALLDARDAGLRVPEPALRRAVRAVERCRLPTGAFTYSVDAIPSPGPLEGINQVKGSLGRIQVCNLALNRAGGRATDADLAKGLDLFFEHQRFLEIARQRPIPHEAYYANASYFYFFGQFYAAQVLARLPAAERPARADRLLRQILRTQEKDGSMWDHVMHHYVKAYGTAYGVMALGTALDARG